MLEFIKPEDRMRFGALALCIIFVISGAAIYMNSGNQLGGGITTPTGTGTTSYGIDTFNGTVAGVNATLLSWDPSLVVVGTSPALAGLVADLKSQGVVRYATTNADGSTTLRLSDSSQVFNVSSQLMSLNLSVYDNGIISIPQVHVVGAGVEADIPGTTFRYNTQPVYDQGDAIPMSFSAQVVNGSLYSLANIALQPGQQVSFIIAPLNVSVNASFWRLSIPWGERNLNANQLEANLPGGSRVNYALHSYINFNPPLTAAQQSALSAQLPSYAVSITPTLMGVKTNMTDVVRVEGDMARAGVTPSFPDSTMDIYAFRLPNESDAQWLSRNQGVFNTTFPTLVVNFVPTYRLRLTLPAVLGSGNSTYLLANQTLLLNSLYPPMDNGTLKAIFTPVGRRVVQFTAAEYSPGLEGIQVGGQNLSTTPSASPSNQTNGGASGFSVTDQNGNIVPIQPVNGTNTSAAPGANNSTASGPQTGTRAINYTGSLPAGAG